MTSRQPQSNDGWNRRNVMKSVGAAALTTGLVRGRDDLMDISTSETSSLPIYEVTSRGATSEQADALLAGFAEHPAVQIDSESYYVDDFGVIQHLDDEAYMRVPKTDETIVIEDEDGEREVSATLDLEALDSMPEPPDEEEMADVFDEVLENAELHPAFEFPGTIETKVSHARVDVLAAEDGSTAIQKHLDTAIYKRGTLEGVPVDGPGSKVRARFSNVDGETVVSDVRHSFRGLSEGPTVDLLAKSTIQDQYAAALEEKHDAEILEIDEPKLVYLAPELRRENDNPVGDGTNEVQALIPHYAIGATVEIDGHEAEAPREFVPAVDEPELVPAVDLFAEATGDQIDAAVEISSGQSPYKVEWSLDRGKLVDLDPQADGHPAEISSEVAAREEIEGATLTVTVTDANGVSVSERQYVDLEVQPALRSFAYGGMTGGTRATTTVPGTADVGHRATDFTGWAYGYERVARRRGVSVSSSWQGNNVWENDYTPETDNEYGVDTADHFFTVAHGNPQGYAIPNGCCDDGWVGHGETDWAWGNHDVEWHSLMSCKVLAPDDGNCGGCNGESRLARWWQEFDGLHQLHGFQTLGWVVDGFPEALGRYVHGAWWFPAQKMRTAWVLAVDNYQPGFKEYDDDQTRKKRGVVMAPVDSNWRSPWDDYFWGHGQVGPDIPSGDIAYICTLVAGTGH